MNNIPIHKKIENAIKVYNNLATTGKIIKNEKLLSEYNIFLNPFENIKNSNPKNTIKIVNSVSKAFILTKNITYDEIYPNNFWYETSCYRLTCLILYIKYNPEIIKKNLYTIYKILEKESSFYPNNKNNIFFLMQKIEYPIEIKNIIKNKIFYNFKVEQNCYYIIRNKIDFFVKSQISCQKLILGKNLYE